MIAVTPAWRDLSKWILSRRGVDRQDPEVLATAAEQACQLLCKRLSRLVMADGCRALVARGLHLAGAEFPVLRGVQAGMSPDPVLVGLRERVTSVAEAQTYDALVAFFANVFGLLATFVGDDLTLRLLRDVWPDAPNPTTQETSR